MLLGDSGWRVPEVPFWLSSFLEHPGLSSAHYVAGHPLHFAGYRVPRPEVRMPRPHHAERCFLPVMRYAPATADLVTNVIVGVESARSRPVLIGGGKRCSLWLPVTWDPLAEFTRWFPVRRVVH